MTPGAIAPQFTGTNGFSRRRLIACTVPATSSLPVPVSPITSTGTSVGATLAMRS